MNTRRCISLPATSTGARGHLPPLAVSPLCPRLAEHTDCLLLLLQSEFDPRHCGSNDSLQRGRGEGARAVTQLAARPGQHDLHLH